MVTITAFVGGSCTHADNRGGVLRLPARTITT